MDTSVYMQIEQFCVMLRTLSLQPASMARLISQEGRLLVGTRSTPGEFEG